MKLKAVVTIYFETDGIMSAKDDILKLENRLKPLEKEYGDLDLDVRERRGPAGKKRDN